MNTEIRNAFLNSLVARACYADIRFPRDIDLITSERYQSKMTASMGEYFKQHFAFSDSSLDDPSGYDAVLFRNTDSGEFYLGNRGTQFDFWNEPKETWLDLVATDVADIVADGVAWEQARAMEEFYQSILDRGLCVTMQVSGHSLGGHLTTLFRILHPEATTHGYTYNGAGVAVDFSRWDSDPETVRQQVLDILAAGGGSSWESVKQFFGNLFSDLLSESWRNNASDSAITNYYVQESGGFVVNAGTSVGPRIAVATDAPLDVLGHGMGRLSDAFLVLAVLSSIDESLSVEDLNKIIEASALDESLDRNNVVAYLGDLFGFKVDGFRKADNEAALQKVAFDILAISDDQSGASDFSATLKSIVGLTSSELATMASQDDSSGILMRHALLNLSSFALQSPSSAPAGLAAVLSGDAYSVDVFKEQIDPSYKESHPETDVWKNLSEMARWYALRNSGVSIAPEQTYINDWNKKRDGQPVRFAHGVCSCPNGAGCNANLVSKRFLRDGYLISNKLFVKGMGHAKF